MCSLTAMRTDDQGLGRVPLMVEKRRAWLRVGMLCGGRGGLVDHLLIGWVE
jgi:hypothetical protein